MTEPDTPESVDFSPYPNRWVAVVYNRVTGIGATREQAYRAAKRTRPKDKPTLIFVDSTGQPLTLEQTWIKKHKLLQQIVEILRTHNIQAYLAGGAVRDLLLERGHIVDLDFAVPDDGVQIARHIANALDAAFYPLDVERGTGRAVCEIGTPPVKFYLDFATFRGATLQTDLHDRDFTINAIALSLTNLPQVIDPLNGRQDLEQRLIRVVSPNAFHRDPVRVLRAVRQAAAFNFSIEPETEQYLSEAASELSNVSPERQREELMKLLNTPAPGQAVRMLHRLGVLPHILPEVEAMADVTQSPPHHLDVFEHTVVSLDAWAKIQQTNGSEFFETPQMANITNYLNQTLAGDLRQRELMPLALLLHDTGKPLTRTQEFMDGQVRIRFLGHEKESAKITRRAMQRLRFSIQATDFVEAIVAHHMRPLFLSMEKKLSRRVIYRLFRATGGAKYQAGVAVALHALVDHRATYMPGEGQTEEQKLLKVVHQLVDAYFEQRDQVVDPPLLLTGRELMELDVPPGPLIGKLLNRLREAQATGQVQDKEAALAFIISDPDFATSQAEEL